eukprot:4278473-Prymnesium_polylepis.1
MGAPPMGSSAGLGRVVEVEAEGGARSETPSASSSDAMLALRVVMIAAVSGPTPVAVSMVATTVMEEASAATETLDAGTSTRVARLLRKEMESNDSIEPLTVKTTFRKSAGGDGGGHVGGGSDGSGEGVGGGGEGEGGEEGGKEGGTMGGGGEGEGGGGEGRGGGGDGSGGGGEGDGGGGDGMGGGGDGVGGGGDGTGGGGDGAGG